MTADASRDTFVQKATATHPFPRQEVLGIPFDVSTIASVVDWLDQRVADPTPGYVCVSNVTDVMMARSDQSYREAVWGGDVVVPDGMPIVWALRDCGYDISARVYGPFLMRDALDDRRLKTRRHVLIAGQASARDGVRKRFPEVNWVGETDFMFNDLDDAGYQRIADELNAMEPDFLWVSLGGGKQVHFMHRLKPLLKRGICLGVGAAFDFHAGTLRQAPAWVQERGLEWAFRLAVEPKRLWRRYLVINPPYLALWARERSRHRQAATSSRAKG